MHAYLAGFFDGEGCIYVSDPPADYPSLHVSANQITPAPLEMLQEAYGGTISTIERKDGNRTIYRWTTTGNPAAEALVWMLPYLTVKGDQARLALEFQRVRGTRRISLVSSDRLKKMRELGRQVSDLKKHSYDRQGRVIPAPGRYVFGS